MQARFIAITTQPSIEIAGYAIMGAGIRTVWRDIHFDDIVAFEFEIFSCGHTDRGILRQYDDAVVAGANTDFVFSTNHTETFNTAQLRLFDGKFLISVIERCAECGHNHLLSGSHIMCSANNLYGGFPSEVNRADVHVVGIGMWLASEHMSNDQTAQPALDGLHLFNAVNFQTYTSQSVGHFVWRKTEINIFFQPFIRNIHICLLIILLYLYEPNLCIKNAEITAHYNCVANLAFFLDT